MDPLNEDHLSRRTFFSQSVEPFSYTSFTVCVSRSETASTLTDYSTTSHTTSHTTSPPPRPGSPTSASHSPPPSSPSTHTSWSGGGQGGGGGAGGEREGGERESMYSDVSSVLDDMDVSDQLIMEPQVSAPAHGNHKWSILKTKT